MPYTSGMNIPLHSRESFFRDPYFSDCWDDLDWEREVNMRPRDFMSDLDDLDLGFRRDPLNRMFGRRGDDLLEREGFKSTSTAAGIGAKDAGVQSDKDNFKVLLDVQQFKPEELNVKICDNSIVIEGKHDEKKDEQGSVAALHFTRKYTIPEDVKVEDVQCNLSSDGVMHITAPRLNPPVTNKTTAPPAASTSNSTEQSSSSAQSTESKTSAGASTSASKDFTDRFPEPSRLRNNRVFDSYFTGFPDMDLVPFWRRRDWTRGQPQGQDEPIERLNTASRTPMGVKSDKDTFKVELDVQQFTPEELTVKTVDNYVIVEGKHADKKDSLGWIQRDFTRKYEIPSDVNSEDVICKFTTDGHLVLSAPRQQKPQQQGKEEQVPITTKNQQSSRIPCEAVRTPGTGSRKFEELKAKYPEPPEEPKRTYGLRCEKQQDDVSANASSDVSGNDASKDANTSQASSQSSWQEGVSRQPREFIIPIKNGS